MHLRFTIVAPPGCLRETLIIEDTVGVVEEEYEKLRTGTADIHSIDQRPKIRSYLQMLNWRRSGPG